MKYFHRTSAAADAIVGCAAAFFGGRMTSAEVALRRRTFVSSLGKLEVVVTSEGGHYIMVTVITDQPGESELDRLARRFLGEVHQIAEPDHQLRGSY